MTDETQLRRPSPDLVESSDQHSPADELELCQPSFDNASLQPRR